MTALAARNQRVGWMAAGLVAAMVGLAFASVPLYRLFCQVTGFDGTTQRAGAAPGTVAAQMITIRFDANVDPAVPWVFKPLRNTASLHIGEQALAFYRAANRSGQAITGTAAFNVTPEIAGQYFNKIECFCFTEQTLEAGQTVDMPVSYFIDPAILDDPEARQIKEITLSYTFFRSQDAPVATGVGVN